MNVTTRPAKGLSIDELSALIDAGFTLVTSIHSDQIGEILDLSFVTKKLLVEWPDQPLTILPLSQIRAVHRPEELTSV